MASVNPLSLAFMERYPAQAARELELLPPSQIAALLQATPARLNGPVLREMLPAAAARALELLEETTAASCLQVAGAGSAAQVLRRLPRRREAVLEQLPRRFAESLRRVLHYPDDSLGAWTDPAPLVMRSGTRADHAHALLQRTSGPTTQLIYLVSGEGAPQGCVGLTDLIRAHGQTPLEALARPLRHSLPAGAPLTAARDHRLWQESTELAVIDRGLLLGVLHRADLDRALAAAGSGAEANLGTMVSELTGACAVGAAGLLRALLHRPGATGSPE